jgi:very-short-patch-repair endonuclease
MDWQDLARGQAGAIGRSQLGECGLTEAAIDGLIRRRDLIEVMPAVYSPRSVPGSFDRQAWAAMLWSGGVVSHRSAARLWRLPAQRETTVHITVADRRFRTGAPGVRLHRVPLESSATTAIDGLLVTGRLRTLIDLLRTERYDGARDLFDRALRQGWLDGQWLLRAVHDEPGRTGNRQLRRLVAESEPGAQAESERALHRILRAGGFRGWVAQHRVRLPGRVAYIDVAFPKQLLAIEVDGRRYHDEFSDRFEDDRMRQNELMAHGWRVLRFTWRALQDDPGRVRAKIAQLLAA